MGHWAVCRPVQRGIRRCVDSEGRVNRLRQLLVRLGSLRWISELLRWLHTYDGMAALGFAAIMLLVTWPLPLHLTTHVLGPERADNFEYIWKLWWVPEAIFKRHISPFFVPDIGYPQGYKLAYGEITPIHTFFLAPLTLVIGPIAVYNLAIIASIGLTGWVFYRLVRYWLVNAGAPQLVAISAFVASTAFTLSGYRMYRVTTGHLPLVDTQWVVLAVWWLERWFDSRHWRDACLTALGIGLAILSSWYYALILLLTLPVYFLARMGNLGLLVRDRRSWLAAGLVIGILTVMCGPFLIPYLDVTQEGEMAVPLDDATFWSASLTDYLMPNPRHPLWGEAIRSIMWPPQWPGRLPGEFTGTSHSLMLLLGTWAWRQVHGPRWRALKWMMAAAFVLSLGPYLKLAFVPLGIPLPVLALREIAPFAASARCWGRFSLIFDLGLCILAGIGMVFALRNASPKTQRRLTAGLLVAVLFMAWFDPSPLIRVEARPVDAWLAEQPDNSVLMQFPLMEALSGPAMLYTRTHHQPVVYGYGTYFPFLFRERYPELLEFPGEAALDRLASWNVRLVLINAEALDALPDDSPEKFSLVSVDAQPRLQYLITLGNERVYKLLSLSDHAEDIQNVSGTKTFSAP